MRATLLFSIGLIFFALTLIGIVYLSLSQRQEFQFSITESIPRPTPLATEPEPTRTLAPGEPTRTPVPSPTPPKTPQFSYVLPYGHFVVGAQWPASLETKHSGKVHVSLIKTDVGYTPTMEIQGVTAVVSTPIPMGTPNVEPQHAFGNEYKAYAVAHLVGGGTFHISLASPESQSLDQPKIDWTWIIDSEDPGYQSMVAFVEFEWKPINNIGEPLEQQIWRHDLSIEVYQPILSRGQVNLLSLLSAFLGSGLSIPWLYETLSKQKTQRLRKGKKR